MNIKKVLQAFNILEQSKLHSFHIGFNDGLHPDPYFLEKSPAGLYYLRQWKNETEWLTIIERFQTFQEFKTYCLDFFSAAERRGNGIA